jgi:hypothetical protein
MPGLRCFCADVHKGMSAASAVIRIDPIVATIMAVGAPRAEATRDFKLMIL